MLTLEEMLAEFECVVQDMSELPRHSEAWEDAQYTWRVRRAELREICPDEVVRIESRFTQTLTVSSISERTGR